MSHRTFHPIATPDPGPDMNTAAILEQMAKTFRERNTAYRDNAVLVGNMMAAAHPDGITLKTARDFEMFHLWTLMFVKMSRFANSGMKHTDSIHDAAVYGAMVENVLSKDQETA